MIEEVPLTGVGLGSFNTLLIDYMYRDGTANQIDVPFENASNWYLHQFAEQGLLGSLGWVIWIIVFIRSLLWPRAPGVGALPAGILKCMLVAFGIASLVGVHAQSPEVLFTFWTFVFWLSTYFPQPLSPASSEETSWKPWVAIVSVACVYTILLGYRSVTTLRVPYRAVMADWNYTYGFYALEHAPDMGAFRWTHRQAMALIPVQGLWLRLTTKAHNLDVGQHPVHVWVRIDGQLATDMWLRDHAPLTHYIPLPTDKQRVSLTIRVDHTWRPADYGQGDTRELGVTVSDWTFLPASPDSSGQSLR